MQVIPRKMAASHVPTARLLKLPWPVELRVQDLNCSKPEKLLSFRWSSDCCHKLQVFTSNLISPAVSNQCPFFHIFIDCNRLTVFVIVFTNVSSSFNQNFTNKFYLWYRLQKRMWQLLNFVAGEAKMTVCISRNI